MATVTTSCCLNLSNPPSLPSKSTQIPRHGVKNEKWRKECVVGMACCMIIGIEMGSVEDTSIALAQQDMRLPLIIEEVADSEQQNNKVPRWSDKRMCPPWHLNSLETIVPENLPRPTARRRWETVRYSKNAPVVKVTTVRSSSNSCFSM
ncbi:uncharacterized protein LOC116115734 [Pistacia vera]|uniref:uncharacterized protein LOC116115734 n=1 Tax=Pistacia vera TaxID=55513 RepID=UPI00126363DB|nr:uncharacterized protein LOC116115734 [Pistacia vera]